MELVNWCRGSHAWVGPIISTLWPQFGAIRVLGFVGIRVKMGVEERPASSGTDPLHSVLKISVRVCNTI